MTLLDRPDPVESTTPRFPFACLTSTSRRPSPFQSIPPTAVTPLGNATGIVAVPLHPDRRRERGYNQAELIAKPLARRLSVKLASDAMVRIMPRPPQLVLSRSEHWKSVRGAYAMRAGAQVDKLRVLLVDDVLTTGATLDACARVLKKAGAAAVMGLTVGRVVPGGSL